MIKHHGDIQKAISELKADNNNSVSFVYENAKQGKGLLEKATITIKDNYATSDAPTQASSKILDGFQPRYDATVVKKLKEAGAAIVGKTHLDELALGGTGQLSAYGPITNPLDDKRIIGGSSSGAAATLTNSISIAIGSDTGDSVRLPASYTGSYGFKPSYGAISRYGLFAFASSLDTVGYFAHNIEDIITTSQVLFGKDQRDLSSVQVEKPTNDEVKPKTVAILDYVGTPDYANSKIEKLEKKLLDENIEVKHVSLSKELQELIGITYSIISFAEVSSNDANLTGIAFGNRVDGAD